MNLFKEFEGRNVINLKYEMHIINKIIISGFYQKIIFK